MANIVGPMFYGGWQDIYAIRQIADPAERAEYLSRWVGLPTFPDQVYDAADAVGHVIPGDSSTRSTSPSTSLPTSSSGTRTAS